MQDTQRFLAGHRHSNVSPQNQRYLKPSKRLLEVFHNSLFCVHSAFNVQSQEVDVATTCFSKMSFHHFFLD